MNEWYVHFDGETLGPISLDSVKTMLSKSRIGFADFVWRPGMTKWVRVYDMDEFAAELPSYPKTPVPSSGGSVPSKREEDRAEPAVVPQAPKAKKSLLTPKEELVPEQKPTRHVAPASQVKPEPLPPVSERRKWPKTRYAIRVPIEAKLESKGLGELDVINISEGGLFVKYSKPVMVGQDIKFKLSSPAFSKPLDMTGVVIRQGIIVDGQIGFAISFTRINPAHKRLIEDYVEQAQLTGRASGE